MGERTTYIRTILYMYHEAKDTPTGFGHVRKIFSPLGVRTERNNATSRSLEYFGSPCIANSTTAIALTRLLQATIPTTMKLHLPTISLNQSVQDIASLIQQAPEGALWIQDLPPVPFDKMGTILTHLASDPGRQLGHRLNQAYPKNLVYKDAYAQGKGGPTVDRKRVLDLSPERLAAIQEADPEVLAAARQTTELPQVLDFWNKTSGSTDKLLEALATAIGSRDVLDDVAFNFRMVDYYSHDADREVETPRCGEHRDFGSFTLIHTTTPGLEIRTAEGEWREVVGNSSPTEGAALMLFGWCTQIRSNGRIPAALHRVVDDRGDDDDNRGQRVPVVPRRLSAILFCAPKRPETSLEPVLQGPTDVRKYIGGIRVGQLRGKMARKWRHREGTADEADRIYEEDEIRVTNMKTQDDVVQQFIAV